MRLFPFDDPRHREASELLPWYANGSLKAAEHALVDAHLRQCLACSEELVDLRQLHAALVEHDLEAAQGLSRIRGRLDGKPERSRVGAWLDPLAAQWRNAAPWMRRAIVVQGAVLAAIASIFFVGLPPQSMESSTQGGAAKGNLMGSYYRVLGAGGSGNPDVGEIIVVLNAATGRHNVQDLVSSTHGTLVAGPSADGAYTLQLPIREVDAALQRLQHDPAVFLAAPVIR